MAVVAAKAMDDEVKRRTAALKARHKTELEELTEQSGSTLPVGVTKQLTERHARIEREARVAAVQAALDDLAGWYRDCLVALGGAAPMVHTDATEAVAGDAQALGAAALINAVELVFATRESLESNVQQGLALEALFLQLSALAYH